MSEPLHLRNFVDGGYAEPRDDKRSELIDPSTGEVYGYAPLSTQADVDLAYDSAAKAFETWGRTTPGQRQEALLNIADAYEARIDELIQAESKNTGKLIPLLKSEEVPMFLDQLRFFAGAARVLEGRASAEYMEGHTSWIRREPVGVVGQVAPWNYPMLMALWKIAPALAAGNSIVLKPSDTTPHTALLMAEIASEFLPAGTFNVVCGDRSTGNRVVSHPTAAMVSITGSVGAGMQVAKAAAEDLKRVHLELGGKAPVVVFADADVAAAAEGIAVAAYFNAGQDCTAATRVLVSPEIHDEFVDALAEQANGAATSYENGANDEDALVPPLNNANQFDRVLGFLSRVPDHASIAVGGKRHGDRGYYVEPTVVTGLEQEDEMIQNEIFGPVITVQTFQHEDEAVAKANGVPYALASSVWTKDFGRAMRMSNRLDFGCVWINTHIPLIAEMPHGGFKHSGYGKDLSMYGLEDYTRIKHVMANVES